MESFDSKLGFSLVDDETDKLLTKAADFLRRVIHYSYNVDKKTSNAVTELRHAAKSSKGRFCFAQTMHNLYPPLGKHL